MTKEMEFFSFLLEQYAFFKKTTADKILNKLDALNLKDRGFRRRALHRANRQPARKDENARREDCTESI